MNDDTIKGTDAVTVARALGLRVSKYADPTEGQRGDLDPDSDYVREVISADSGLIYLTLDSALDVAQVCAVLHAVRVSASEFWAEVAGGDRMSLDIETVLQGLRRVQA
jgi:hypothetical protein